jgi:hypothetical protein
MTAGTWVLLTIAGYWGKSTGFFRSSRLSEISQVILLKEGFPQEVSMPDDNSGNWRNGGDPLKHQDWRDGGKWKHGGNWNPKKHEEESKNKFDYKKQDWNKGGKR